jgi:uncharacterized membrane protein
MTPWIGPDDTWTLWAVMVAGTGAAIWLEQAYRWAAKVSAPLLALGLAMILSNAGVMPMESPAYKFVEDYLVPIALALMLFRANLFRIVRTTGSMFVAFHISSLGTILGAIVATLVLRGHIDEIEHAAGMMTASYIGGGINFFAVKGSYNVSSDVANPLLVADNFVMAGIFVVLLAIAGSRHFLQRFPHPHSQETDADAARNLAAEHWRRKGIGLLDVAKGLAFAFVVVALAKLLERAVAASFPADDQLGVAMHMAKVLLTNDFVLITAVSLAAATAFHRQLESVNGPEEIGGYLIYLFLFSIGLPADLVAVLWNVPLLFVFCGIIAVINVVVTLALGKLGRFGLEELLLSINANLGGPATAAAMAVSRGWSALVLPAILVGIWGYAIGTFVGIWIAEVLMRM